MAEKVQSIDTLESSTISQVAIIPSPGKHPNKPLVLLDQKISEAWSCDATDILVYEKTTLANINAEKDIASYRLLWHSVVCATPSDFFLPELKFMEHTAEGLPGGLVPEADTPLVFAGEYITPLLPVSSILLEYFTPEDLVGRMKFRHVEGGEPQVEVSLNLPLTGMRKSGEAESYCLTRIYPLKQANAIQSVPVLELWPNFISKGWKAYYALFFDLAAGSQTFRINFPESAETETFKDEQGGSYSLTRLEVFPSSIECLDETNQVIGLIFPKQPPEITPNASWKVGVDFGPSFTNVCTAHNSKAESLVFDEDLLAQVTESPLDTRFPVLFNYFVPERFLPMEKPFPCASVLTMRGSNQSSLGEREILDGRVFNPMMRDFDPQEDWIITDLDWNHLPETRLFLKNLILLISATALKQGAKTLNWKIAYPSNLSRNKRNLCAATWNDLTDEMAALTGLHNQCSRNPTSDHFISSNLAVGQYFCDQEQRPLESATCIYIEQETADITIWQNNQIIHQCSVNFGRRDLLSNFLERNPGFAPKLFDRFSNEWIGLRGDDFHAKLDTVLKWESEAWLKRTRPTLTDSSEFQALNSLMALGFGGLYYYVGLLLKSLQANGIYKRNRATPIYLAGTGSSLLHWLDPTGHFTQHSEATFLLSRMLSQAAGFPDTGTRTYLSSHPQDEVAYGLVSSKAQLTGMNPREPTLFVPGEAYEINSMPYPWDYAIIPDEDVVTQFDIPNFDNLSGFVFSFHQALQDLRIESIAPLSHYTHSTDYTDNVTLWQATRRSLDDQISQSKIGQDSSEMRSNPPFLIALKSMLDGLAHQWAREN